MIYVAIGLLALVVVTSEGALGTESAPLGDGTEARVEAPQDPPDEGRSESGAREPRSTVYERLMVVGEPERVDGIPGAVHVIGKRDLERQRSDDIHRALRQVPGLNIQEEEGFGLRPNLGIRGTGTERSAKITLMEDGGLIAPAPYAAPAAYYVPTMGRMEAVEVRKGSSTIKQGPYTTGGAINLISTSIPSELAGRAHLVAGDHGWRRLHAHVGGSSGRLGWLVEGYLGGSDGFKHLDTGGSTGFDLTDLTAKMRVQSAPEARFYQALELKVGKTRQTSDETYLGLTEEDFRTNPLRRYAGSAEDVIDTDHEQVQLRHFLQLGERADLTTTLYRNDLFRNWRKLQSAGGAGLPELLDAPATFAQQVAWVRGDLDSPDDALKMRNNRRTYYSQGAQSVLGLELVRARWRHSLEVGVRFHQDEEDRFQEEDGFRMAAGRMVPTSTGAPGSQANRIARARAWALFIQDTIDFGRWTLTPGVRLESIDFARLDYGRTDPARDGASLEVRRNDVQVVVPGLGVAYRLDSAWILFAGAHRGFAPPGAGASPETRAETSVNLELGFRHRRGPLSSQVAAFFHDYDNLLGRDTLAAGGEGSGRLFNGGEVDVRGLEVNLAYDLGQARGWRASTPLSFVYTYTSAEFRTSFTTTFADWAPEVAAGDRLPYLPEHQGQLAAGLVLPRWSLHVETAYLAAMRTRPGRGPIPAGEGTDAHWVVDLSAEVRIAEGVRLLGQVRNLTDETYIAARRPAGLRPGLPRTVLGGLILDF